MGLRGSPALTHIAVMDEAGGSSGDGREDPTLALVAVQDRTGSGRRIRRYLEDRGMYLLKGIDGDWRLLAVARP
jgi:hypothetical protein